MYECTSVGARTHYLDSRAKIGICQLEGNEVCLIDTGFDKEAGRRILKFLREQGWNLKMILNTHSHPDHVGGNNFIQSRTGCPAYCPGMDRGLAQDPILLAATYYGGYPCKDLRNKFFMAEPSQVSAFEDSILPQGMEAVRLDGQAPAMIGLKSPDGVWFLADALFSEEALARYHIPVLYNVEDFLHSLEIIEGLEGELFIPSHAEPARDILPLVEANRRAIRELIAKIELLCADPICAEDLLTKLFDAYELQMDLNQYALVGATIRSFLSYLRDQGRLDLFIEANRVLWRTQKA